MRRFVKQMFYLDQFSPFARRYPPHQPSLRQRPQRRIGRAGWDDDQHRLWERLRPIRTGDYGGSATIELEPEEEAAVLRALRCCAVQVELDADDQRRLVRLIDAA